MLPDMIKTAFAGDVLIKVTNVRTIANAIQQSEIYKLEGTLIEIDKVLEICFTFSVTSATAERCFHHCAEIKPTYEIYGSLQT